MRTASEGDSAAGRALRALRLLDERDSVGVSEAARALRVAPSTASRLLATVQAHGFAVRDGQGRYRLSPAAARLAVAGPDIGSLRDLLHGHLQRLAEQLGETTHLVVLEGPSVRFVDSVEARRPLCVTSRAGRLLPAYRTSGGKALLATLPEDELTGHCPDHVLRADPGAEGPLAALRAELAQVRRHGYAVNREESEEGITAIGAAVLDRRAVAITALSVSAPTARLTEERIVPLAVAVCHAAARAGQAL